MGAGGNKKISAAAAAPLASRLLFILIIIISATLATTAASRDDDGRHLAADEVKFRCNNNELDYYYHPAAGACIQQFTEDLSSGEYLELEGWNGKLVECPQPTIPGNLNAYLRVMCSNATTDAQAQEFVKTAGRTMEQKCPNRVGAYVADNRCEARYESYRFS